ncbi:sigma-54-dependent Fis family transcriptional regulator [bacterium]|nr:sigma-54-dependent Fis family transcriptional regulator [bacterium]
MNAEILLVDDEENIRKFLSRSFEKKGYKIFTASSGEEALKIIEKQKIEIIILDINLPGISGIEVLEKLRYQDKNSPFIVMITAYGDVKTAVKTMKIGANDYITKPFEFAEIEVVVQKAFDFISLTKKVEVLEKQLPKKTTFAEMVAQSQTMLEIFEIIEKVAKSPTSTILITGETGTGKELCARAIHQKSDRKDNPFVAINCTTIQENLLESELFGHEKGSFTDAKDRRKGLFEVAGGGTILLDEIGDMDAKLQAKLLRVLQEKTIRRIGGNVDIPVNLRVIATTHQNLEKLVSEGTFRQDLFFRLNVIPIEIPPLRNRREDIILLAEAFLNVFNKEFGKNIQGFSTEAKHILTNYLWLGNIRELKNTIERIVLIENCQTIEVENLPKSILLQVGKTETNQKFLLDIEQEQLTFQDAKNKIIDEFEVNYIRQLLEKTNGNVTHSSEIAKTDRSSFQRIMRKHGIKSRSFKEEE